MPFESATDGAPASRYGRSIRQSKALALALLAAATSVGAAKQGQSGVGSTASIGISFEVRPHIHARQMSLSTPGSDSVPSSSSRRLCLNMSNVAGFTLNTIAPLDIGSRLTPVDFALSMDRQCRGVTLTLPATVTAAPQMVIISPI